MKSMLLVVPLVVLAGLSPTIWGQGQSMPGSASPSKDSSPGVVAQPGSSSNSAPGGTTGNSTAPGSSGVLPNASPPGLIVSGQSPVGSPVPDFNVVVASAKTQAKGKNIAAAELTLTQHNVSPPNTAAWKLETTQRLLHLAGDVARDGDPVAAGALAAQSLQYLNQVAGLTTDTRAQASAKASAGFIHERFTGDPQAAIASYQAALKLAPDDKATQEALVRLEKADAILRSRIRPAKK